MFLIPEFSISKQRSLLFWFIPKPTILVSISVSQEVQEGKVLTHFVQLIFTLDFSLATLGVQGIAVSPIHTPSMEFVTGFSSFEGGKKKEHKSTIKATPTPSPRKRKER